MKDFLKYDDVKIFKYENLYLSVIYTIGHIFVAMMCNRIITGASLDMAAADAFVEPIINGFWFYLLFEVFNRYKRNKISNGMGRVHNFAPSPKISKLAPVNNKKHTD